MTVSLELNSNVAHRLGESRREVKSRRGRPQPENAYGVGFWLCYAANLCLTLAFGLLFRYADFVSHLGGTELNLGFVVGVGMVGALAMRAAQGIAIDRYGPRKVWLWSLAGFTVAVLAHLLITRVDGVGIFVARILLTTSTAGAFGASITYISLRVPPTRMGEMVGTLGTSGFIGLALGPTLADAALAAPAGAPLPIHRMFLWAAAMSFAALLLTLVATRRPVRMDLGRRPPPLWAVVRRYHPGAILLVAAGMGLILGLPHTFVRAYTAELDIPRIRIFFLVYASVAFVVRIFTRRLADQIGPRPVILCGLTSAAASMLLYLGVRSEASLAIPAVLAGTAHALLFPAVLAGGCATFPSRYRGIATTLMLASFDTGQLIGQPAIGSTIRAARWLDLPAYPTMFLGVSVTVIVLALFYACRTARGGAGRAVPR
jgi:MFS family permease